MVEERNVKLWLTRASDLNSAPSCTNTYKLYYLTLIRAVDTMGVFSFSLQIFFSRMCAEKPSSLVFILPSCLHIRVPYIKYPDANPHNLNLKTRMEKRRMKDELYRALSAL